MKRGEDPLRALRGAWEGLDAPPPWRELEEEDAATRRSVAWVASAWRALEAPAVPSSAALRAARPARPRRSGPRLLALAATATAAAAAAALLLLFRADPPPPAPPGESAVATSRTAPAAEAPVEVRRNDAGQVELRSGPVRLVVLPNTVPDRTAPRSPSRQR